MLRARQLNLFLLFAVAYFLSYFFRSANAVIAGDLTRELGLSAAQLGLMTSLFYASFAAAQLPLGAGLDRFGPRLVTPALMLAAALGSLLFARASSFAGLALGRMLIGLGMAGVLMGAFKAFGQWFAPRRLATVSGVMVGLGASGGLAAGTPLAVLNVALGWRTIFLAGAGVVVLSAASLALWTRNTPPGVRWHAADSSSGGLHQIFRDVRFWRIAPLNFFMLGTVLAVQGLWAGPFLFDVLRLPALAVGNLLLAMSAGVVVGYFACGWLGEQLGLARVVIGAALLALLCHLVFILPVARPIALLYPAYFGLGCAGTINLLLLDQARALFPPTMSGRAATAVNMFGFGGTALLQWWMGLIIAAFAPDSAGHYPPIAYAAAFLFTAIGTALALLWYLPLARQPIPAVAPTALPAE